MTNSMYPHVVTLVTVTLADNGVEERNTTTLHGVLLDSHAGGIAYKSGMQSDDDATAYIPESSVTAVDPLTGAEKQYLTPALFNSCPDKSSFWTVFSGGKQSGMDCYFVKGLLDPREKIDYATLRKAGYDVFRVTKANYRDYGAARLRHWEIGGK